MDNQDRRVVVVGGSSGIGRLLAARLAASTAVMVEDILIGYPKRIEIIDTPEIIMKRNGCTEPQILEGHYWRPPIRSRRKHWNEVRTLIHEWEGTMRRQRIQRLRRQARRAMRKAMK